MVDDLLVYNGTLKKYDPNQEVNYQLIYVADRDSTDDDISTSLRGDSQDVVYMNDSKPSSENTANVPPDETLRPFTCISPFNRTLSSQSQ